VTPEELIQAQAKQGLSNAGLARLTGRSTVTVWRWRRGLTPVPEYAIRILSYSFRTEARQGVGAVTAATDGYVATTGRYKG